MRRRILFPVAGVLSIVGIALLLASCSQSPTDPLASKSAAAFLAASGTVANAGDSTLNGRATAMPAYYDSALFTINFTELPSGAETALLAHNGSINNIYEMDPDLPGNQPFIPVLDAIQGDGFNPLWQEVEITFNEGFTPHQFFRDDAVLAAAAGSNPEITLTKTTEVYRCAVLGPKK